MFEDCLQKIESIGDGDEDYEDLLIAIDDFFAAGSISNEQHGKLSKLFSEKTGDTFMLRPS